MNTSAVGRESVGDAFTAGKLGEDGASLEKGTRSFFRAPAGDERGKVSTVRLVILWCSLLCDGLVGNVLKSKERRCVFLDREEIPKPGEMR